MSSTATLDPREVGLTSKTTFGERLKGDPAYQAFLLLADRLHRRADPLRPRQVRRRHGRLGRSVPGDLD